MGISKGATKMIDWNTVTDQFIADNGSLRHLRPHQRAWLERNEVEAEADTVLQCLRFKVGDMVVSRRGSYTPRTKWAMRMAGGAVSFHPTAGDALKAAIRMRRFS